MEFLNDPGEIYRRSFAAIEEEVDLSALPEEVRRIVLRVIHACGMPDIAEDLRIDPELPGAVRGAVRAGRPVFVDVRMVECGIIRRYLPQGAEIRCHIDDPETHERARRLGVTRAAAATALWRADLAGSVCVIGNAPTALFTLLEMLDNGAPAPAAIIAFPVGFVGAAESKAELDRNPRGARIATLLGRRGGAGMAAAAFNAIMAADAGRGETA
jgi:precorrin-8X/cobalt-precorrin-8 methylmutase